MNKIAIQGAAGSFHEMAARKYFGANVELVYCETFEDVFAALQSELVQTAVLAIGNSRFGDINHVYDTLIRNHRHKSGHRYWITGEIYVAVELCLLGLPGTKTSDIKEVHSQIPALGQCFSFLHNELKGVVVVEQDDTAKSAQLVHEWSDPAKAAIASEQAGKNNGLEVLAHSIQDDKQNVTRFLVITIDKPEPLGICDKSSLLLRGNHAPGSLVQALGCFSDQKISLSYIQSVPVPEKPFKYNFYIDIEAGVEDARTTLALNELTTLGYEVDVLGSYQTATMPDKTSSQG